MFEATKEQIQQWKQKHGEIIVYEVEDLRGYFRKPTRKELSYAGVASNQMKDALKYTETLMNTCWLGGDKEILEKDEYFLGAAPVIDALSEAKVGEVKKL